MLLLVIQIKTSSPELRAIQLRQFAPLIAELRGDVVIEFAVRTTLPLALRYQPRAGAGKLVFCYQRLELESYNNRLSIFFW
ncbi:MAG: hypothetical protein AAGM46_11040 [Cyanobacteria bacterium J06582_2]